LEQAVAVQDALTDVVEVLVEDITEVVAVVVEDITELVAVIVEAVTDVVAVVVEDITEVLIEGTFLIEARVDGCHDLLITSYQTKRLHFKIFVNIYFDILAV
jgi:hypothetical protein